MSTENKKETFGEIIAGDKLVLVDFTAEWCGPCKMMKPILEELHQKMGDNVRILKLDVDKNREVANAFNISGVPTLILFKKGETVWRQSGVIQAPQLEQVIRGYA